MFLKETSKKIVILSKTGLNIENLYKNWIDSVSCSCVVPLRKECIRSYLLILFSKSKSNNTNESQQVVSIATGVISLIQVLTT